jgi:hypothetical protein
MRLNKKSLLILPLTFILLLLSIGSAYPEETVYRNIKAVKIEHSQAPVIDGNLEETIWKQAIPADTFIQREPYEGKPATENTEVRVLYDDESIYLGISCYDSEPQAILAKEMRRDAELGSDDSFTVMLDTFGDCRTAYMFETNPLGAQFDAVASSIPTEEDEENIDITWNGVWYVKTAINDWGWSAEVAVPFKILRFARAGQQRWGVNFRRIIRRKNEETLWCAYRRNQGVACLAYAGKLDGLNLPSPPRRLEFRPYVTAGIQQQNSEYDRNLKSGLDVKYGLGSNLNLDLTLNTDFAQAEVDQNVINLTRFSLFFPEKREFFIEGNQYFSFGEESVVQPFHSRRIGLSADRREVPILTGARLTGKTGRTGIGVLAMETQAGQGEPSTFFSVVRVQRDILSQSNAGLFMAYREPFDDSSNRTFGSDFTLSTSKLMGNRNLTVSGYLFGTQTPEAPGGLASSVLIDYPNDFWRINVRHTEIQGGVNPGIGYIWRKGIRQTNGEVKMGPRPELPGIRQLFFKVKFSYLYDRENVLLNRDMEFRLLGIDTQWGDKFELNYQPSFERLDEDFEIVPGVFIPSGGYKFNQWEIQWEMSDARPIAPEIKFHRGEYYNGHRTAWDVSNIIKLGSHFSFDLDYNRNDIQMNGVSFSTNELGSKISYAVTTSLTTRAFVQWNNEDDEVNLNLRLSFLPSSGSTFFLIYNSIWGHDGSNWHVTDRAVLLKWVIPWPRPAASKTVLAKWDAERKEQREG